jgi:hypothetical protein
MPTTPAPVVPTPSLQFNLSAADKQSIQQLIEENKTTNRLLKRLVNSLCPPPKET